MVSAVLHCVLIAAALAVGVLIFEKDHIGKDQTAVI